MQATALPALVIVLGIFGADVRRLLRRRRGRDGAASLTGLIVALDAFVRSRTTRAVSPRWPTCPHEVRDVTDPLDAVGDTTKAIKGYAIGSAALAALVFSRRSRSRSSGSWATPSSSPSTTRTC